MPKPLNGYAVSKAGVMRLTECLAAEPEGAGVTAITLDTGLVSDGNDWTVISDQPTMS